MPEGLIAGIDPGLDGAVCLMSQADGYDIIVFSMPTLSLRRGGKNRRKVDPAVLADALERWAPTHAFIEDAWGRPVQGSSTACETCRNHGIIIGILAGLKIPVTPVPPQRWKKALGVPAAKDGARARASQLLPSCASHWARAKDDGKAEAALLCLYGLQRQ